MGCVGCWCSVRDWQCLELLCGGTRIDDDGIAMVEVMVLRCVGF